MTKEPTQETEKGHEIPVPKRADVLADLRKVAKADQPKDGETDDGDD